MLTAALVLLLTGETATGPPDSVAYWLNEIVVTATRSSRPISRIPVSVSVITNKEIRSSNARSFADLLEQLPGISVQRTGEFGRSDPIVRGLGDNGKRLLVLVDGRPEKMAIFGCTVTHTLPLGKVERVEVVRTALSHLYGSEAMGGVINILSSRPRSPLELGLQALYGTDDTQIYQVTHGGARHGFSYSLTADHRSSGGHVPNSSYEGTDLGARVDLEPSPDLLVHLGGKWFNGRKHEPAPRGQENTFAEPWNDYLRYAGDASADWGLGNALIQANVYVTAGEHEFSDGWHSKDRTLGLRAEVRSEVAQHGEVLAGFSAKGQWGQRLGDVPWDGDRSEAAAYIHAEHPVGTTSTTTLGLRYAADSEGNAALSPAVAMLWRASHALSFRGSATSGFRFPQLSDLHLLPSSNPDLTPERSVDLEVGATARLGSGSAVQAAVFQRELWDLIETLPYSGSPPSRLTNAGRATFRGLEATLRSRLSSWLEAALAYTHLDPRSHTKGRVRNKADLRLRVGTAHWDCSLTGSQVWGAYAGTNEAERLPDYLLVSVKSTTRIGWGVEGFFALDNVLDEDYFVYAELPGSGAGAYRMPGRRFTVGLALDVPRAEKP
jgi:outer membrane cobalamin receptor